MHGEKQNPQLLLGDAKAVKEPVGNQRVGEKAATERVHGEQGCDAMDNPPAFQGDGGTRPGRFLRLQELAVRGKQKIQTCNDNLERV